MGASHGVVQPLHNCSIALIGGVVRVLNWGFGRAPVDLREASNVC